MADPASYGNSDRDIDQDETTLIWYSRGAERNLKLSSVSKIIPGQRTPVFKRFLRPEKEYLSFSLIYNNGERSLDLICKDKIEAEIWITGLKNIISAGQARSRRTRSDITDLQNSHPCGASLDFTQTISRDWTSSDPYGGETYLNVRSSDVGSERGNMQVRTSSDGFRISVSSTPSCSSGGSGPDDIESLGDVYVWGEIWCDGSLKDGIGNPIPVKHDVLTPKPLESNVVLDVHQIACGVRHVALVTRQGEVFTWGEESGGRLGHGVEKDFSRPRLVEFLAVTNVDFVSCGEFHTCAVSTLGDLYTWGDGTHNAGLLGHGNDVSHWIPKRVSGPLEGLQVLSVACGTWHSALATVTGKLFTFGDGTYGALGHGNRVSLPYPREVHSLNGLKTIKVACGVWHTAAIVEVTSQNCGNVPTRKLFTWGDGDKNRLGHGNKEAYLLPTCVSALIDYNFHQLACGHNITVGLTTSGHVFIMGSNAFGQLGNPQADGKSPSLVQDKLVGEFVEEIACGASHVAVLTSRSEVFTWGKGANGRLGHGDLEDRNSPTLIEALKDRHVKNIACGSNYTASICIHKWVSGADQSVCSGCRQAFGFTRKRHNCYNCGLVHCHACSSKKALKAALAPTPGKPHRVCDSCYMKLKKASEGSSSFFVKKFNSSHRPVENSKLDRGEVKISRALLSPTIEPIKYLEVKSTRPGIKSDNLSIVRASQVPSLLQLKDIAFPSSLSALQHALKPVVTAPPQPQPQPQSQPASSNSRPASPYSRRPSPPRSPAPVFSRGVIDSLRKTNDVLHQEVAKLQNQIKSLKQKSDGQESELRKLKESSQESARLVSERASKCNVAVETMKSITSQLKEMTQELPPDISKSPAMKSILAQVESFLNTFGNQAHEDNQPDVSYSHQKPTHRNTVSESVIKNNLWDAAGIHETPHNVDGTVRENHGQSTPESVSGSPKAPREGQKEVIEQFEPGVYVTLLQLTNGSKIFKRVRFSKRRFAEQQAEEWWKENKDRLLKKYSPPKTNAASATDSSCSSPAPPAPPAPPVDGNSEASQSSFAQVSERQQIWQKMQEQQQHQALRSKTECQIEHLNAQEPNRRFESEAGVTEFWDFTQEQFECAGIQAVRHEIRRNGLLLPYYSNAPQLVYIVQGSGVQSTIFPGCAETFETESPQSRRGEGGERGRISLDRHQKIRRFRAGDILALPAGVTHWSYNDGDEPIISVSLIDTSNQANQLDLTFRKFFLAGNPQHGVQQQVLGRQQEESSQYGRRGSEQESGGNMLSGFDAQLLSEAFNMDVETIRKIQEQAPERGIIVRAENLQFLLPEESEVEEEEKERRRISINGLEETFCTMKLRENIGRPSRSDVYNPRGGRLRTVNSNTLPILNSLQLSAERGTLYRNAIVAPHWNMNAHTIIYIIRGSGRIQVVGNAGKTVFNDEVRQGQLLVVPQNFAMVKKAGEEGLDFISFKTNDNAMISPLAGRLSAIRAMPEEVLMNSYQISRQEARSLKYNRDELSVFGPGATSSRQYA
ncbi:hypothetical protein HAX54_018337 [Datura stramonium]|uniref:Uncharacterized protein n=1 Tax=Datura stramonium TaxID=4076 RepID=A0ABS8UNS8_DATST|nr:hypothetical protein [Datura stramonium]